MNGEHNMIIVDILSFLIFAPFVLAIAYIGLSVLFQVVVMLWSHAFDLMGF